MFHRSKGLGFRFKLPRRGYTGFGMLFSVETYHGNSLAKVHGEVALEENTASGMENAGALKE